jgi:subfamily B ATP-binding cassette protein MsbA
MIVLKNLLLYVNQSLLAWLNGLTGHKLRGRIFDSLMRAPISFWDHRDPGKIMETLSVESWKVADAFELLSMSTAHACTVVVFTGLLFAISWKLSLIVFCGLGSITAAIHFGMRRVQAIGEDSMQANAELGAHMWDGIAGIRSIHVFSLQSLKQQRFREISTQVHKRKFRLQLLYGLAYPVAEVLHASLLLGVLLWVLPTGVSGPMTLVFLLLLFRLQPSVARLQSWWVALVGMAGSFQNVAALLDATSQRTIRPGEFPSQALEQSLAFEGVTFKYDAESAPALKDIAVRIPAGKVTAIVGPSGAGKTTLIHLICRFYEASAGEILVDGRPLPSLEVESWRRRIGLASQDTHLFSATVRENIAFGACDASDDQIIQAAILAGAHDFIVQLPQGYDTRLGERGLRLSGGQRQRIALARAFVRNPEILILDEATNALDGVTEEAVSRSLREMERKRTIIIVAHRLATISMADHVIVIDQGRVVQQGHPSELMRTSGVFSKLFRAHSPALQETE